MINIRTAQTDMPRVASPTPAVPQRDIGRPLFLLSSLIMGGSERKVVRVANELSRRGHLVQLAYLNQPHTLRPEISPDVPVHHFDRVGKFSIAAAHRLAQCVAANRIDRIVCVNMYPVLYAQAVRRLLRPFSSLPITALINSTHFLDPNEARQMKVYAPLLRHSQNLVFGCAYHRDHWIASYRLDKAQCGYIHNGVDTAHFAPRTDISARRRLREEMGINDSEFLFATVGRLVPEKRQADLVRAIGELVAAGRAVKAVIVGEGPEQRELQRAIAECNVGGHVLLPGMHKDIRPILAASDAFALNSSHETFSNAALEAMSMGLPVVMSDLPSAREMVETDVNGVLYPVGDIAALAARLFELASKPADSQRMGMAAREQIERRFAFERMVDEYERVLGGPPNATG